MAIAVALVAEIACAAAVLVLTPTATTGSDRLAARIHADIGPAVEAIEKFWDRPWNRDVGVVTTHRNARDAQSRRLNASPDRR